MKKSNAAGLLLFLFLSFAPCYAHHIAVVVSKDSNVDGVTSANLVKMFKAEIKKWPDGKNVVWILQQQSATQLLTLERLNNMSEAD